MLTTLSTVGFGDFYPKSDVERLFISMIMLSGIIIFNIFMSNILGMISLFEVLIKDLDDSDKLP